MSAPEQPPRFVRNCLDTAWLIGGFFLVVAFAVCYAGVLVAGAILDTWAGSHDDRPR